MSKKDLTPASIIVKMKTSEQHRSLRWESTIVPGLRDWVFLEVIEGRQDISTWLTDGNMYSAPCIEQFSKTKGFLPLCFRHDDQHGGATQRNNFFHPYFLIMVVTKAQLLLRIITKNGVTSFYHSPLDEASHFRLKWSTSERWLVSILPAQRHALYLKSSRTVDGKIS